MNTTAKQQRWQQQQQQRRLQRPTTEAHVREEVWSMYVCVRVRFWVGCNIVCGMCVHFGGAQAKRAEKPKRIYAHIENAEFIYGRREYG